MEPWMYTIVFTFFNFCVLYIKLEKGMWESLAFDIGIIISLNYMFIGMKNGMLTAMGVSFLFTLLLWIRPPKFLKGMLA